MWSLDLRHCHRILKGAVKGCRKVLGTVYQQTHELFQQRQNKQLLCCRSRHSHSPGARTRISRAKLVNHSCQWGHPGQAGPVARSSATLRAGHTKAWGMPEPQVPGLGIPPGCLALGSASFLETLSLYRKPRCPFTSAYLKSQGHT